MKKPGSRRIRRIMRSPPLRFDSLAASTASGVTVINQMSAALPAYVPALAVALVAFLPARLSPRRTCQNPPVSA